MNGGAMMKLFHVWRGIWTSVSNLLWKWTRAAVSFRANKQMFSEAHAGCRLLRLIALLLKEIRLMKPTCLFYWALNKRRLWLMNRQEVMRLDGTQLSTNGFNGGKKNESVGAEMIDQLIRSNWLVTWSELCCILYLKRLKLYKKYI